MTYTGPRNEMIERVAKAIRDSECGAGSTEPHEDYMDDAYAAIMAMREPTVQMVDAMSCLVEGDTAVQYTQNTYDVWRGMVDAVLR